MTRSPGVLELGEVPEPGRPGPRDVIIRPQVVGICGSDLHLFEGDVGALSGARHFFPRVQGHELAAVIETAGRDCPPGLRPGDRVAVFPLRACGRCYPCRVGQANACVSLELVGVHTDGGLQELLCLPAAQVFGVGELAPDVAAFAEPMSIAVHALARAGIGARQQVAVLGAGPIGLAVLVAAVAAGARVLVADPVPGRRELAARLGAERVIWGGSDEVTGAARDWSRGEGPPRVLDTTGDPAVLAQATELVSSAGRVVVVGMSAAAAPVRSGIFPEKEIEVAGSSVATVADFRRAVRLVRTCQDQVAALLTHRFPLARARDALACVAGRGPDVVKVLITLNGVDSLEADIGH
ncbi:MAG: alcohol dehydrogenase catalytic domain-containing protein [Actinobacteria bacterium]|nr:alcohol dehydrogenase catalytic domain-containing protein [Actinomycetota bacterium]